MSTQATSNGPAQPRSLANKTFTTLAEVNDKVLNEDYIYGTFETWKLKGKTADQGKWDYKGKVKDIKKGLDSELKIQFPYNRYWVWLGLRSAGDLKVHVDLGDVTLAKKQFNLFANVKTTNKFDTFRWRLGANYFGNNYENNARIESNASGNGYSFTERVFSRRRNFFYGLVGTVALDNFRLQRFDGILGFDRDNVNLYFKFEGQPVKDRIDLAQGIPNGKLTVTGIYTKDRNVFGAELTHSPKDTDFQVATQRQINDNTTLKAKLNKNLDLAFAWKHKWNRQLNITASAQLQLKKGSQAIDF